MNFIKRTFFILLVLLVSQHELFAQDISIQYEPRNDLNIGLPPSVIVYEGNGFLPDSSRIRAFYAAVDLRDENLKLRAIGSNEHRETTKEAYEQNNGILAINGGYFSANSSVSLLISDGEIISPGPTEEVVKGAFGMVEGIPQITWSKAQNENSKPYYFPTPLSSSGQAKPFTANQAVGGGPVLLTNGKINITAEEEGFSGSHLLRHPRTAIGYRDKNNLIMMVVDGRQNASAGVTLPELAQLMKSVGAKEAVNLDGGGSSAMVAANEVVNIPTDIPGGNRNSLRKNASALVLSQRVPSEKRRALYLDTHNRSYQEKGRWKDSNQVNYYGGTPSRNTSAGLPYNSAVYHFDSVPRNQYQLAAWWSVDDQNTIEASYILHRYNQKDTIVVNQRDPSTGGKWNILGNFVLGSGDSLEIKGTGEGKLVTDAVRLIAEKDSPQLPVRGDVRIAVISDLNSGLGAADYEWQVDSIIKRIPRIWKPDLIISGGDMVAGMGVSDTNTIRKMWAGFDEHIAGPLREANIPFAFTLGNHDGPRSYQLEREMTVEYWKNSQNTPGLDFVDREHFPHYYSFVKDGIFFISWDASSSQLTEENIEWVEEQLQKPEAQNADYRFVLGHMPLYSVAQERDSQGNVLDNPDRLQKLIEEHDVHTYISGHQHAYYPGKRGNLHLLNAGAAGSGPRGWLSLDEKRVNTVTIMDIFKEEDSIAYTTYEINEQKAEEMAIFIEKKLPSAMFGVNGHLIRRDIPIAQEAEGSFSALNTPGENEEKGMGRVNAEIRNNRLVISGNYRDLEGKLINHNSVGLYRGRNTEEGTLLQPLKIRSDRKNSGRFSEEAKFPNLQEYLSVGALYVSIKTEKGELRTQLYPPGNHFPPTPTFTSHNERNVYAVRNIEALYQIEWEKVWDEDGDFISYIYQLAKDPLFQQLVFQKKTCRTANLKLTEKDWFELLGNASEGETHKFYHRVIATDGKNQAQAPAALLKLMKSSEPLQDFIEVPAPAYEFAGKIENAEGAGYGAEYDRQGKLWLADYRGSLIIKEKDGSEAAFSPLKTVTIGQEEYDLNPVNGVGIDLDGNILIGRNRHLLKVDASTGEGIAVWEVPEGERAITSPRANEKGEVYAMSLFGEDPNYVLKQSSKDPTTFELVRTINLKERILSRTFDMSRDGRIFYFPDPGSPVIQKYSTEDGINYTKEKEINSTPSGSSAVKVIGKNKLFAAVRASGTLPSTFHFRDETNQRMWTLELPEVNGAEPRGIGVSPDQKVLIFCSWDKGGGYYKYVLKE